MSIPPSKKIASSRGGFAIVIVLAAIVLLVGVAVAFLTNALQQRQISESSATRVKTSLLAEAALNTVVGDLKSEIKAGSTISSGSPYADGSSLYIPTAPKFMTPQLIESDGANGLENLLKISSNSAAYDGGETRGSSQASDDTSEGGRAVSLARWNKPLLMPAKSATDLTPDTTFKAPNWIYLSRDGTNPQAFNENLKVSKAGQQTVLGRFAYAIYNEGGLLDVNAAGYPQVALPKDTMLKSSLAYADMAQVFVAAGFSEDRATEIVRQIVDWRNKATLLGGEKAFHSWAVDNPRGFLTTANTAVAQQQSDRIFGSRQQLQKFLFDFVAPGEKAQIQKVLPYLTTFSRDLNQPSYIPNSLRPKVMSLVDGGNDGNGGDDLVNPSFLGVRAKSTKAAGRNNGTDLKEGEPLVNQRFALNRLAWLTYKGPIASVPDVLQKLVQDYGFSEQFLQQGDAAAIEKYFGLRWDASNSVWVYVGSPNQAILTLSKVADLNREPNFLELLKAGINVGAIGRPSIKYSAGASSVAPLYWQSNRDRSIDLAIVQIAANIFDQYDLDGYPTRIQITLPLTGVFGTRTYTMVGVENLPYIYKVRAGVLAMQSPNPAPVGPAATIFGDTNANSPALKLAGAAAFMMTPEIWNPHSWNPQNENQSLGDPRPLDFRLVVDSTVPDNVGTGKAYNSMRVFGWKNTQQYYSNNYNDRQPVNGFPYKGGYAGNARPLNESNSVLTFSVPNADIFREPTLLFKAGIPDGSNLKMSSGSLADSDLAAFRGTSGLKTLDPNPGNEPVRPSTQEFVGIYFGLFPLRFIGPNNYVYTVKWANSASYASGGTTVPTSSPNPYFTTRLQFKDPNGTWRDYDQKYTQFSGDQVEVPYAGVTGWLTQGGLMPTSPQMPAWVDPRTARFGAVIGSWSKVGGYAVPGAVSTDWIDSTKSYISSDRPDTTAGFSPAWDLRAGNLPEWEGIKAVGWITGGNSFRRGMFSQNLVSTGGSAVIDDGKKYASDNVTQPGNGEYYSDADNVVRRAMGGYVSPGGSPASTTIGLPLAKTMGGGAAPNQRDSRPIILNRPFRSVAELGYVFSGTPWKNLDFFSPESGFSALLDVFCIAEPTSQSTLVAGKVDLNTRQSVVIQAILSGAYKDEFSTTLKLEGGSSSIAERLASKLIDRTNPNGGGTKGPLTNISELVGRLGTKTGSSSVGFDGDKSYDGFSKDLTAVFGTDATTANIERFRESAIRPLAAVGQTRVWNLLIDLVAQSGRFPAGAKGLPNFVVDGERRYWVHIALDRLTGKILDQQIELVKE